jgi:hypothetical protein
MIDPYSDVPGSQSFELIAGIAILAYVSYKTIGALLTAVLDRNFGSLKFFVASILCILAFIYFKKEIQFPLSLCAILLILYLVFRGVIAQKEYADRTIQIQEQNHDIINNDDMDTGTCEKIILKCPECYQKLRIPAHKHGLAKCPKCKSDMEIKEGEIIYNSFI